MLRKKLELKIALNLEISSRLIWYYKSVVINYYTFIVPNLSIFNAYRNFVYEKMFKIRVVLKK